MTGYWEWVLGELRQKNSDARRHRIGSGHRRDCWRAIHYNTDFEGTRRFRRRERNASAPAPATARNSSAATARWPIPPRWAARRLSGKVGAGLDPCAALQAQFDLQPGEEREVIFTIRRRPRSRTGAVAAANAIAGADACRDAIYMVRAYWNDALGAVHVETPDPALNFLANGWLLYQTLVLPACGRARASISPAARSDFAINFRMRWRWFMRGPRCCANICFAPPPISSAKATCSIGGIRRTDRGVRTHFSDDYLWLPYATCRYVEALGDTGVLDENVPFLEGRAAAAGGGNLLRLAAAVGRNRHALRTLRPRDPARTQVRRARTAA